MFTLDLESHLKGAMDLSWKQEKVWKMIDKDTKNSVDYISPLEYCEDGVLKTVEDGYFLRGERSNQTACYKGNYCTTGEMVCQSIVKIILIKN